jgi:hypothetical protein
MTSGASICPCLLWKVNLPFLILLIRYCFYIIAMHNKTPSECYGQNLNTGTGPQRSNQACALILQPTVQTLQCSQASDLVVIMHICKTLKKGLIGYAGLCLEAIQRRLRGGRKWSDEHGPRGARGSSQGRSGSRGVPGPDVEA